MGFGEESVNNSQSLECLIVKVVSDRYSLSILSALGDCLLGLHAFGCFWMLGMSIEVVSRRMRAAIPTRSMPST